MRSALAHELAAGFDGLFVERRTHLGLVDLAAGSAIYLPAGQEHGIGVVSDRARIVTILTPGSFSRFVQAAGTPFEGDQPEQWEFDVSRIVQAAAEHDIVITGPPPAV